MLVIGCSDVLGFWVWLISNYIMVRLINILLVLFINILLFLKFFRLRLNVRNGIMVVMIISGFIIVVLLLDSNSKLIMFSKIIRFILLVRLLMLLIMLMVLIMFIMYISVKK